MIYFWDLQALKQQWKTGQYTDRHTFGYVVATALALVGYELAESWLKYLLDSPPPRPTDPYVLIAQLIGTMVGLVVGYLAVAAIYRSNGGDQGNRILDKTVSINFVLLMRFYPALLLVIAYALAKPYLEPTLVVMLSLLILAGCLAAVVTGFVVLRRSLSEIRSYELTHFKS